jgi:hypothetical protein
MLARGAPAGVVGGAAACLQPARAAQQRARSRAGGRLGGQPGSCSPGPRGLT